MPAIIRESINVQSINSVGASSTGLHFGVNGATIPRRCNAPIKEVNLDLRFDDLPQESMDFLLEGMLTYRRGIPNKHENLYSFTNANEKATLGSSLLAAMTALKTAAQHADDAGKYSLNLQLTEQHNLLEQQVRKLNK